MASHIIYEALRNKSAEALLAAQNERDQSDWRGLRSDSVQARLSLRRLLNIRGENALPIQKNPEGGITLAGAPQLHANLSHCRDAVAAALGDRRIGVDIEPGNRKFQWRKLAQRVFTADEKRALAQYSDELAPQFCLQLWSLKEAWLKAQGLGLPSGLENIGFQRLKNNQWLAIYQGVAQEHWQCGQVITTQGWILSWATEDQEKAQIIHPAAS